MTKIKVLIVLCLALSMVTPCSAKGKTYLIKAKSEEQIERFLSHHRQDRIVYILRENNYKRVFVCRKGAKYYDDTCVYSYPAKYTRKDIMRDMGYMNYKIIH